jgi:hypothetical protein
MNEARARLVTEYIEECWHTMKVDLYNHPNCYCTKCGTSGYGNDCRTFANWNDFGRIVEVLQEKEDWEKFLTYAHYIAPQEVDFGYPVLCGSDMAGFSSWLFTNPARFCNLVGEWLESLEKKGE